LLKSSGCEPDNQLAFKSESRSRGTHAAGDGRVASELELVLALAREKFKKTSRYSAVEDEVTGRELDAAIREVAPKNGGLGRAEGGQQGVRVVQSSTRTFTHRRWCTEAAYERDSG